MRCSADLLWAQSGFVTFVIALFPFLFVSLLRCLVRSTAGCTVACDMASPVAPHIAPKPKARGRPRKDQGKLAFRRTEGSAPAEPAVEVKEESTKKKGLFRRISKSKD